MISSLHIDELEHEAIESSEALVESVQRHCGAPLGLRRVEGERASVAELFDGLAGYCGGAMRRHFGERFEVIGAPGEPLQRPVEPGDILLVRPLAEGGLALASAVVGASGERHDNYGETIEVLAPPLARGNGRRRAFRRMRRGNRMERRSIMLDVRLMPHDQMIVRIRNGRPTWPGKAPEGTEMGETLEAAPPKPNQFVQWVQRSLNQILGLSLATNGVAGEQTRKAIKQFQSQNSLVADGL